MAQPINIKLDTSRYKRPTVEDVNAAKEFVLQRGEYGRLLVAEIDELLEDAAQEIVSICYRYDFEPKNLYFGVGFNEQMMDEISAVMDELEEKILALIDRYCAVVVRNKAAEKRTALLAWLSTLGHGNRNLRDTLDDYLYKFMKDLEASVAALKYTGADLPKAITRIKAHLHSIYTMPEMQSAFKRATDFTATYVRSRGVQQGGVGLSNNGSTNVTNMARTTLDMAWMRQYRFDMAEKGAAGYYVSRGSSYPCALCDSMTGFHPMTDIDGFPPYHPHCCCFVIPIQQK